MRQEIVITSGNRNYKKKKKKSYLIYITKLNKYVLNKLKCAIF